MKVQLRFTSLAHGHSISPGEKATSIVLNLSLLYGRVLQICLQRRLSSGETTSSRVWTLQAQMLRQ